MYGRTAGDLFSPDLGKNRPLSPVLPVLGSPVPWRTSCGRHRVSIPLAMRAIVAVHEALLLDGSAGDELVAAAVVLLNSEWGRSEAAREVSVRNCKEDFPVNLALVEGPWPAQGWRAVAFVRLSRCDDKEKALLVESRTCWSRSHAAALAGLSDTAQLWWTKRGGARAWGGR